MTIPAEIAFSDLTFGDILWLSGRFAFWVSALMLMIKRIYWFFNDDHVAKQGSARSNVRGSVELFTASVVALVYGLQLFTGGWLEPLPSWLLGIVFWAFAFLFFELVFVKAEGRTAKDEREVVDDAIDEAKLQGTDSKERDT